MSLDNIIKVLIAAGMLAGAGCESDDEEVSSNKSTYQTDNQVTIGTVVEIWGANPSYSSEQFYSMMMYDDGNLICQTDTIGSGNDYNQGTMTLSIEGKSVEKNSHITIEVKEQRLIIDSGYYYQTIWGPVLSHFEADYSATKKINIDQK